MRIIGGILKGKNINFLKKLSTRPLKDSVKENVFNILVHSKQIKINLQNSNILDLYSGIGSFGLEALSRGAKKVTFVEKDQSITKILKKNLFLLSLESRALVFDTKVENFLDTKNKEKYDIFFFDPPFADNSFFKNLDNIKKKKIFNSKHIIIIHRDKKTKEKFENYLNVIISRNYGRSKIIFGVF